MNSIKSRARFAGFLYLLAGIPGALNVQIIPAVFLVPGDATATASNIAPAEFTYRVVMLSGLVSS